MTPAHWKWMSASLVAASLGMLQGCCCPCLSMPSFCHRRSAAIPDRYPIGSVMREHFHVMQTNAEASDFIIHQHEFVGETGELTCDGKDHILEVASRMRSAPFPVIVERTENNANPELDAERRYIVASILSSAGNPDADQRTIVSTRYDQGLRGVEAQFDYNRFIFSRGINNGNGNNGGGGGGLGGGGGAGFGR